MTWKMYLKRNRKTLSTCSNLKLFSHIFISFDAKYISEFSFSQVPDKDACPLVELTFDFFTEVCRQQMRTVAKLKSWWVTGYQDGPTTTSSVTKSTLFQSTVHNWICTRDSDRWGCPWQGRKALQSGSGPTCAPGAQMSPTSEMPECRENLFSTNNGESLQDSLKLFINQSTLKKYIA